MFAATQAPAAAGWPRRSGNIDALAFRAGIERHRRPGDPELPPGAALIEGHFSLDRLRDGFFLHCTDLVQLCDLTSRSPGMPPGVKVLLKLEGDAEVRFGGTALALDAGQGAAARPCGAVLGLFHNEEFERRGRAGVRERMVVITLEASWFAAAGRDSAPFGPHLAIRRWQPSARAIAIAEHLVRLTVDDGPAPGLIQEARALELVAEAFAQVTPQPLQPAPTPPAPDVPAAHYLRICRLRQFLDSGRADRLDMTAIAHEIGCNPNTLQQQFRRIYGQTIFDYLRVRRLERAARALQADGISVAQAADLAGYTSQANFSTAFRRHFGLPPKRFRDRL